MIDWIKSIFGKNEKKELLKIEAIAKKVLSLYEAKFIGANLKVNAKETVSAAFKRYHKLWPEANLKLIELRLFDKNKPKDATLRVCFEVFGDMPGEFFLYEESVSMSAALYALAKGVHKAVDDYRDGCNYFRHLKETVAAIRSEEAQAKKLKEVKK